MKTADKFWALGTGLNYTKINYPKIYNPSDTQRDIVWAVSYTHLDVYKRQLDPWVIRWEQSLQRSLLLPGEKGKYFIKLNVDGLLRGDYQSRMN